MTDTNRKDGRRGLSRRILLSRLVSIATLTVSLGVPRQRLGAETNDRRRSTERKAYMQAARDMREQALSAGDQGYGAVIVKGGEIIGRGPSGVVSKGDPTAHAEIEAIRDACRRLGTNDLSGCTMYGTSAPCPMCETAAYWARLDEVRFGADGHVGRAPRYGGC